MFAMGLSGGYGHDAAACIVNGNTLIAYAEEERYTRVKHAINQAPVYSALYCLEKAGIQFEDLDVIALSWLPEKVDDYWNVFNIFKNHPAFRRKKFPQVIPVNHHLSHAASSYLLSGFKEATILVIDGQGDDISTSIAHGKDGEVKFYEQYPMSQSLGFFYSAVNSYLNLGESGEGKLMGLASYGSPKYDFPISLSSTGYSIDIPEPSSDKYFEEKYNDIRKSWFTRLYRMFGEPIQPTYYRDSVRGHYSNSKEFSQKEKDIAASAQSVLETTILHLAKLAIEKTNCRNLVISGGVGLNCSANGKLERSGLIDELYILPATHDAGACIGAAMTLGFSAGNYIPSQLSTPYWGREYTDDEIYQTIKMLGIKAQYSEDAALAAARYVSENKIVGWFQGAAEMGPRALGNRSIIANPSEYESYLRMNRDVKNRELWRPLAPSVLWEKASWLVENSQHSPYMLKAYDVKENVRNIIPAVVHVDGTARPQTVREQDNHLWYRLITEFNKFTGIPLVLNTSLNGKDEPVCETPLEAVRTFYAGAMDSLVLGNFIISK